MRQPHSWLRPGTRLGEVLCSPRRECTRVPQRQRPVTAADMTAGRIAERAASSSTGGEWITAVDHATDAKRRDGVTAPRQGGCLLPRLGSAQASFWLLPLCAISSGCAGSPGQPPTSPRLDDQAAGAAHEQKQKCFRSCAAPLSPRDKAAMGVWSPVGRAPACLRARCQLHKMRLLYSWRAIRCALCPSDRGESYIFARSRRRYTHVYSPYYPLQAALSAQHPHTRRAKPAEHPGFHRTVRALHTAPCNRLRG